MPATSELKKEKAPVPMLNTPKPATAKVQMSEERIEAEKKLSSKRCKVEWPFHQMKMQFRYRKVRYIDIFKNACRIIMLLGLSNLFAADCCEARIRNVADAIMAMPTG